MGITKSCSKIPLPKYRTAFGMSQIEPKLAREPIEIKIGSEPGTLHTCKIRSVPPIPTEIRYFSLEKQKLQGKSFNLEPDLSELVH